MTRRMLERVYGGGLGDRRPGIRDSLELRAGLRVLHREQIALLRDWQSRKATDDRPHVAAEPASPVRQRHAGALGATG